jgi:hypothetical protein
MKSWLADGSGDHALNLTLQCELDADPKGFISVPEKDPAAR